jgi:hypothetical protein
VIERKIPGTPHAAEDTGTYVPQARDLPVGGALGLEQPYLGYQIDGKGLASWTRAPSDAGFAFDPDHLNAMADEWKRLAQAYSDKQQYALNLTEVRGPGAEYASEGHADAVHITGRAMIAAFADRQQYCEGQAQKFRTAAGQYAAVDDDSSKKIGNTDTPPAGSPL